MIKNYSVNFNWYGEIYNFKTQASNPNHAKIKCLSILSKKVGYKTYFLKIRFAGDRDNFKIEEIK